VKSSCPAEISESCFDTNGDNTNIDKCLESEGDISDEDEQIPSAKLYPTKSVPDMLSSPEPASGRDYDHAILHACDALQLSNGH
jgi:hypothetical protein